MPDFTTDTMRVGDQWAPVPPERGGSPPDATYVAIRRLAQYRPAAGVAFAVHRIGAARPVAIHGETEQASDPFDTAAAIYEHFSTHHHDGAGVLTGRRFGGGGSLVAVAGPPRAWWAFMAEHGSELRDPGTRREHRSYVEPGFHTMVQHHLPAQPPLTVTTYRGDDPEGEAAEVEPGQGEPRWADLAAADQARRRAAKDRLAWLLWNIAADMKWRPRELGDGLRLLAADAATPLYVERRDGHIRGDVPRGIDAMPRWLADHFGLRPT